MMKVTPVFPKLYRLGAKHMLDNLIAAIDSSTDSWNHLSLVELKDAIAEWANSNEQLTTDQPPNPVDFFFARSEGPDIGNHQFSIDTNPIPEEVCR